MMSTKARKGVAPKQINLLTFGQEKKDEKPNKEDLVCLSSTKELIEEKSQTSYNDTKSFFNRKPSITIPSGTVEQGKNLWTRRNVGLQQKVLTNYGAQSPTKHAGNKKQNDKSLKEVKKEPRCEAPSELNDQPLRKIFKTVDNKSRASQLDAFGNLISHKSGLHSSLKGIKSRSPLHRQPTLSSDDPITNECLKTSRPTIDARFGETAQNSDLSRELVREKKYFWDNKCKTKPQPPSPVLEKAPSIEYPAYEPKDAGKSPLSRTVSVSIKHGYVKDLISVYKSGKKLLKLPKTEPKVKQKSPIVPRRGKPVDRKLSVAIPKGRVEQASRFYEKSGDEYAEYDPVLVLEKHEVEVPLLKPPIPQDNNSKFKTKPSVIKDSKKKEDPGCKPSERKIRSLDQLLGSEASQQLLNKRNENSVTHYIIHSTIEGEVRVETAEDLRLSPGRHSTTQAVEVRPTPSPQNVKAVAQHFQGSPDTSSGFGKMSTSSKNSYIHEALNAIDDTSEDVQTTTETSKRNLLKSMSQGSSETGEPTIGLDLDENSGFKSTPEKENQKLAIANSSSLIDIAGAIDVQEKPTWALEEDLLTIDDNSFAGEMVEISENKPDRNYEDCFALDLEDQAAKPIDLNEQETDLPRSYEATLCDWEPKQTQSGQTTVPLDSTLLSFNDLYSSGIINKPTTEIPPAVHVNNLVDLCSLDANDQDSLDFPLPPPEVLEAAEKAMDLITSQEEPEEGHSSPEDLMEPNLVDIEPKLQKILDEESSFSKEKLETKQDTCLEGSTDNTDSLIAPEPEKVGGPGRMYAAMVIATGSGLYEGKVSGENTFELDTSAAEQGELGVHVVGPQPDCVTNTAIFATDPAADTLRVTYTATLTGEYVINITWDCCHITGSPFTATLT